MKNLRIAQKIANKIDDHTQDEIDAIIDIVCDVNEIDVLWMHKAVSNIYMKSESYKPSGAGNSQSYSESDPR